MSKVTPISERVNPIVLTDVETGNKYILEFNRQTVERAEKNGFTFSAEKLTNSPMTTILDLWYWSFQMHNRGITRDKTTEILEQCGGISDAIIERLGALYNEPFNTLVADEEVDGDEKNVRVTIQL